MIIGSKKSFAIEYHETDETNMGYGKLWLEGNYYGTNEDLIHLKGYLGGLVENLLSATQLENDLLSLEGRKLFNCLMRSNENDPFKIGSSTFTDDFMGFKFLKGDRIDILWRLEDRGVFDELRSYPMEILYASIPIKEIKNVRDVFFESLNSN